MCVHFSSFHYRSRNFADKGKGKGTGKNKSYPYRDINRPLGRQEVEAKRIYRQSVHEDGKVISTTHRPPLSPSIHLWYSFLIDIESTPGP